jgi:cyanophycinase
MNNLIALLGSGEYLPVMNDVDRYLLSKSGADGRAPRVICLPTAAGEEGEQSWGNWMRMGEAHFRALDADVKSLPVIDRASADDPRYEPLIESADLIYFSGGNPHYLFQTLNGSRAWNAAQRAWSRGAIYAGCSAGAMILGKEIPNFRAVGLTSVPAFGALPARMIFPHFDRWMLLRGAMVGLLQMRLSAGEFALGIDEDTALVGHSGGEWIVMGRQTVSVIFKHEIKLYSAGEKVELPQ